MDFGRFVSLFCIAFVVNAGSAEAKISFREPLHEPRIYEGAPPGVHVTTLRAYDPGRKPVTYNLLDVRDHAFFSMEPNSGNITTAKKIDKKIGETYEIIAVAVSQGETKLRQLQVSVTDFNVHPPSLEQSVYVGELHVRAKVGTLVLRVHANDEDPIPYNAEVYYSLTNPENSRGRFSIAPRDGTVRLTRSLESSTSEPIVELGVVAVDGGSPKRYDYSKIKIFIKTISAPKNIRYTNTTGTTVSICWNKPDYGQVLGYIVKYQEVETAASHGAPDFRNVTTSGDPSMCTLLKDLKSWKDYTFRVYGWNRFEEGQGSIVGTFGTRPDYCRMNICQHGECHSLNKSPGYQCDCAKGYYGEVCQHFDPCSLDPCSSYGACKNISSQQWRCECLPGFSGQNCSEFNPCALRPSPCLHGGRCESSASHKYQCHCTRGHYGKTCQYFDPCSTDPCKNNGKCQNISEAEFVCQCIAGFAGKQCEIDVDECSSSPCKHGATCRDGINSFHCRCAPGYRGKRCHLVEHCPPQTISSTKGLFRWNSTSHGRMHLIKCPFGSVFYDREASNLGFAKRRCYLLSNGSVAWGLDDTSSCREEGYKNAEELTAHLWFLTKDPRHINLDRMQEATRRMEGVLDYALNDKKIAQNVLSIVSNMLAINDSLLRAWDPNGTAVVRVRNLVERFVSEVRLERGESLALETENLGIKAVDWDPDAAALHGVDELVFHVRYRKKDKVTGIRRTVLFWDDDDEYQDSDSKLTVPMEALALAQNQTDQEFRIKFVAYKSDKFFPDKQRRTCGSNLATGNSCLLSDTSSYTGRQVLQVSISNASISNLSNPVMYALPSPSNIRVFCCYWKEDERLWSTEGVSTNQSSNVTLCFATHMTSFSLLLDSMENLRISSDQSFNLSFITYIGCGLSMMGLILTIVTYSIFRCLNRYYPGQVLLHLSSSMLLLNAAFLTGGYRGSHIEVCTVVAVLLHYFLLTSFAWMCVEVTTMYHLLKISTNSAAPHFMLKRTLLAWGIPFIVVGVTVLLDWNVYNFQNEYCVLSSRNPYAYYLSFIGPCCLIFLVNTVVFLTITWVLLLSVPSAKQKPRCGRDKNLITATQVKGAFIVMVFLAVSWVFGNFSEGKTRFVFQYVFCITNSLQGILMFVVRCLLYQEARSAWYQLLKTGTFKAQSPKHPGNWSDNADSKHIKLNDHLEATKLGSLDASIPFNTNAFWASEKEPLPCGQEISSLVPTDYVSRGELLTFSNSSTLKSLSGKDASVAKPAMRNKLSGTHAETFQDPSKLTEESMIQDIQKSHYIFELSPSVLIETTDAENGEDIAPREVPILIPKDPHINTLLSEPSNRNSYTAVGNNDDNLDAVSTLDRKIFVSNASRVFENGKGAAQDCDKQSSWPTTFSSFLGNKEPLNFTRSDPNSGSLPLSSNDMSSSDMQNSSAVQVIPLQVRPTSSTFSRDSESCLRNSNPSQDFHYHHHQPHVSTVGRTWRDTSLDTTEFNEAEYNCTEDSEVIHVLNRQGVLSPKETIFSDSATSRL